jgi:hypothetical protein
VRDAEERAWIEHIRAKKATGEPLTSQEETIWAYSQYGSGLSGASGGCFVAGSQAAPKNVTEFYEPLGEN